MDKTLSDSTNFSSNLNDFKIYKLYSVQIMNKCVLLSFVVPLSDILFGCQFLYKTSVFFSTNSKF